MRSTTSACVLGFRVFPDSRMTQHVQTLGVCYSFVESESYYVYATSTPLFNVEKQFTQPTKPMDDIRTRPP